MLNIVRILFLFFLSVPTYGKISGTIIDSSTKKPLENVNIIYGDFGSTSDKEGRFLIPEELKLYAGIKTEAAFFGQGHYFQIWEPKKGLKNTEVSRGRLLKEKKSLRMMLTQQK